MAYQNNDLAPDITAPSLFAPTVNAPTIKAPTITAPYAIKTGMLKSPRVHAKSMADIILGNPLVGTEEMQDLLADNEKYFIAAVPILNRVVAYGLMQKERYIEPALKGEWGKVGINFLESLGDTADVLANPIKSLMPWAGGGTPLDLMRSMGWAPGEYRKRYNWDTGSTLVNILGEIVSDPVNWFTFGGKAGVEASIKGAEAAVKEAATKTLGEGAEYILKQTAKEATKDVKANYIKQLLELISNEARNPDSKIIEAFAKRIDDAIAGMQEMLKKTNTNNPHYKEMVQTYKKILATKKVYTNNPKVLEEMLYTIRNNQFYKQYKAAKTIIRNAKKVQTAVNQLGILGAAPVALPMYLYKKNIGTQGLSTLINKYAFMKANTDLKTFMNDNARRGTQVNKYISLRNKAIYSETFDKLEVFTSKKGISHQDLVDKYMSFIAAIDKTNKEVGRLDYTGNDYDNANKLFKQWLLSEIPELKTATLNNIMYAEELNEEAQDVLQKITPVEEQIKEIFGEDIEIIEADPLLIDEVTEEIGEAAELIYSINEIEASNLLEQIEIEMQEFFNKPGIKLLGDNYSTTETIRFLDAQLKQYTKYGIYNLDKVYKYIDKHAPKNMNQLIELLNFTGINLDNHKKVTALLKQINNLRNKLEQLKENWNTEKEDVIKEYSKKYYKKESTRQLKAQLGLLELKEINSTYQQQIDSINKSLKQLNQQLIDELKQHRTGAVYKQYNAKSIYTQSQIKVADVLTDGKYKNVMNSVENNVDTAFEDPVVSLVRRKGIEHYNEIATKYGLSEIDETAYRKAEEDYVQQISKNITEFIDQYFKDTPVTDENLLKDLGVTTEDIAKTKVFIEETEAFLKDKDPEVEQQLRSRLSEAKILIDNYQNWLEENIGELKINKKMYELLEEIDKYTGNTMLADINDSEAPDYKNFIELLNSIKDFNSFDDPESFAINLDNIELLKRRITQLDMALTEYNRTGRYTDKRIAYYSRIIRDLKQCFNESKEIKKITAAYGSLINEAEAYYFLQLSKRGSARLIQTYVASTVADTPWFKDMCNPKSRMRSLLDTLLTNLNNLDLSELSPLNEAQVSSAKKLKESLQRVIGSIDAYNRLLDVLYRFETGIKNLYQEEQLTEKEMKFLKNLIWDTVENFSRQSMDDFKLDAFIEDYLYNARRYVFDKRETRVLKELNESAYKQFLQDQAYNIELTEFTPITELDRDLYTEIKENLLEPLFKEYTDAMMYINTTYGPFNFGTTFSATDVAAMNELGLYYNELSEFIRNMDITNFEEVTNAFENLVIGVAGDQQKNFYTSLENTYYKEAYEAEEGLINSAYLLDKERSEIQELIQREISNYEQNSFARSLTSAFNAIGNINEFLQDAEKLKGTRDFQVKDIKNQYKKLKSILNYISVDEFNSYVREYLGFENAYDWSITNGLLAVKKLDLKNAYQLGFSIPEMSAENIDKFNKVSVEIYQAYSAYTKCLDLVKDNIDYYKDSTEVYLREALKNLYADTTIKIKPINSDLFFSRCNKAELLAWDAFTKNYQPVDVRTAYSNIKRSISVSANDVIKSNKDLLWKLEDMKDPINICLDLTNRLRDNITLESEEYIELLDHATGASGQFIFQKIQEDMSNYIKDIWTLGYYKQDIDDYIQKDIAAIDNTKPIAELNIIHKGERKMVKGYIPNDKAHASEWKLLKSFGIRPNSAINSDEVMQFLLRERTESLKNSILKATAPELRYYIDHYTEGVMFFVAEQNETPFKKLTPEKLKDAGLIIKQLPEHPNIYVIRPDGITTEYRSSKFKYLRYKSLFPELQNKVTQSFKNNRHYFAWNGIDMPNEMFTGSLIRSNDWQDIMGLDEVQQATGDLAERISYSKINANGISEFYKRTESVPNMAIVGAANAYNQMLDIVDSTLDGAPHIKQSTKLDRLAINGSIDTIKRVNSKHKYLQLFMNKDFSLDSPMFKQIFKDASDEEIREIFKRNNFEACIVKQGRHGEPRIYKIYINGRKNLNEAIKNKALILPHDTYRNAVLSINEDYLDTKLFKFLKIFIAGTFKTMYLTNPGFLLRNGLDSLIFKNASSTGGIASIAKNFEYEWKAAKLLQEYDDIYKEARAITKEKDPSGLGTINNDIIRGLLSKKDPEFRARFALTHLFQQSGGAAGITPALEEMLLDFNKYVAEENLEDLTFIDGNPINNIPYVRQIMNINNGIESYARYGLFLNLIDNGVNPSDAIRKVIDTHFDYDLKYNSQNILEQIFWFSTFPINNMFYYLNQGLTENPDMLRLQLILLEQSYNNNGMSWDDVRNSKYLTYNALVGNLRFRLGRSNKDLMLKTGSSVLDFFSLLYNPIEEIKDRLNPFLAVLLGYDDISSLNPINTNISRLKQFIKGESIIPSIYSKLRTYPPKLNKPKINTSLYYGHGGRWRLSKPKKPKRPSYSSIQGYKTITKRYFYSKKRGKYYWKQISKSITPYYNLKYRHQMYNRNYKTIKRDTI